MSLYRRPKTQYWWCEFERNGRRIRLTTGETDKEQARKAELAFREYITNNDIRVVIEGNYILEYS